MEGMIFMVSWCHVSSSLELPPSTMAITMLSKLWLKPITGRTASTFRPPARRGGSAMAEASSISYVLFA